MIAERLAKMAAKLPGPLDDFWYRPAGAGSVSGVQVTPDKAMAVGAVFACIRLLSDTVGSLPVFLYERLSEDERTKAQNHPVYELIHRTPNPWQTTMDFYSLMVGHLCLRGNFYARIDPERSEEQPSQLVPLNPDRMSVEQLNSGRLVYRYKYQDGQKRTYSQDEILHVRGFTTNGVTGISVLEYARNAVGLSIAQETHGGALFQNGGFFKYYIRTTKRLGDEGRKNFRKTWRGVHGGADRAYEPPILEDDLDIKTLGMSLEDSQWVEARKFQAEEICRFFGVPPHMIHLLDRATFNNIEHMQISFVIYTLRSWLVRIEQAISKALLAYPEQYYVEFNVDGLLRGDMKSRYEAFQIGIQQGFLTRNEVRRLLNLPPLPGLDEPLQPLNMAPVGTADSGEMAGMFSIEPLVVDVAQRIVAAELRGLESRAGKAADDRERWNAWTAEFYEKHLTYVQRTLEPLAAAVGADIRPISHAMKQECERARQSLADGDVPTRLACWEEFKAESMTRVLSKLFTAA
jgi:HK97 family phage portal protein